MMKTSVGVVVFWVSVGCGGPIIHHPQGSTGGGGESAAGSGDAGSGGSAGAVAGAAGASVAGGGGSVVGAAGTAGIEAVQEALSGTRLKAYWYTGADGAKQFAGKWYDSVQKVDCYSQLGIDGVQRCLPTPTFGSVFFSDSGCTARVLAFAPALTCANVAPQQTVDIVAFVNDTSCYEWVHRGSAYAGPTFSGKPGACSATGAGFQAWSFYSLGAAVDLTAFQMMTLAHD